MPLFSQQITLTGKLVDSQSQEPLPFANVVLLQAVDSAFVKGVVTDGDGSFVMEVPQSGQYLLRINYLGYEQVTLNVQQNDMGVIHMSPDTQLLSEVVVTSKTPPFQAGIGGGIVANVSTTLLSTVGTANDVLQRMPGIAADNGKITVFGKGAPIVYINNRKVRDVSELERLESSEISTVELITNPGAKYDAEGRAVLLIKTKTKINGFSAQLTERLRQGKYLGDNENASISYTKDKLNLFATYNHNYRKQETTEDHHFALKNADGEWRHSSFLPYWVSSISQEIITGFDYSINDKHAIGGQYQYYNSDIEIFMPINTTTHLNDILYETSQSQAKTKGNAYQHLVNAFYNGDFSDHYLLRFDFDYLKNYDDRTQHSDEIINTSEKDTVDILNQTNYDLWAGKLTNSYKSNVGLIEFGGEYNHIAGNGFVRTNGVSDDSDFTNKEQKAAAFVSYSHKLSAVNVVAGLRYEFTSEQFTEGTNKTPIIDRTYSDFYPNISFSTNIKNVDLSLAFNKRTQRPGFTQLNGNVVYINRFVFQKGNPYLNKSNIYDVNFQTTLKPFYLNVGYVYVENPVMLFFQEQEKKANALLLSYANFPKMQEINATLNFNHKLAFWQPNYTAGFGKPFFSAIYDGQETVYNKVNYFFRAYNDFTLPQGWVLSCNFRYQSDQQDGFFESKGYQRFDAGLRKSFLNNNLRMNLMVYDIFDWVKDKNCMQINNLRWDADKKNETRYATLSISYLFNNYKKKYRGGSAAGDDINRF
ncbi:hypothetical protein FACS189432_02770 [Bacteroidia bacterium]|nr:hypothetical protein FACS189432_02770 [Bacteroidia bacterium]